MWKTTQKLQKNLEINNILVGQNYRRTQELAKNSVYHSKTKLILVGQRFLGRGYKMCLNYPEATRKT